MKTASVPFHVIKNRNPNRQRAINPLPVPGEISLAADLIRDNAKLIANTFGTFKTEDSNEKR